jgi:hypothetical protein
MLSGFARNMRETTPAAELAPPVDGVNRDEHEIAVRP